MRAIGDCYVASNAVVTGDVVLGPGVNIWYGCIIRGDLARITFGPRVNLQDGCIVHTDTDAALEIDEGVVVGHGAILHGARIGRDSLIGIGVRLLSGSEIGAECLVAAGCVVPPGRKVPPRSVVMGIPGQVVREITAEELERTRVIGVRYLELAQRDVRGAFPPPWQGEGRG